jgi:hypothetical protein
VGTILQRSHGATVLLNPLSSSFLKETEQRLNSFNVLWTLKYRLVSKMMYSQLLQGSAGEVEAGIQLLNRTE